MSSFALPLHTHTEESFRPKTFALSRQQVSTNAFGLYHDFLPSQLRSCSTSEFLWTTPFLHTFSLSVPHACTKQTLGEVRREERRLFLNAHLTFCSVASVAFKSTFNVDFALSGCMQDMLRIAGMVLIKRTYPYLLQPCQ